jgi:hypothetical protein
MNLTNKNAQKPVKQTFSFATRFVSVSGLSTVSLNPVVSGASSFFGPCLVNFANLYQEFRFLEIRVKMYPFAELPASGGNSHTAVAIGHNPMVAATAPSSLAKVMELSESAAQASACTLPVEFKLGRKQLLAGAQVKWFHCDTTPDPDTATQGEIHYYTSGTNSSGMVMFWVITATLECRAPVPFGEFVAKIRSDPGFASDDSKDDDLQPNPATARYIAVVEELKGQALGSVDSAAVAVVEEFEDVSTEVRARAVPVPNRGSTGGVERRSVVKATSDKIFVQNAGARGAVT